MCVKSIYKKLAEDFDFVKYYGFSFVYNLKHNVTPSILFKQERYEIQIGFSYEDNRFYVNWYDSANKRYLSKEKLEWIEKYDTKNLMLLNSVLNSASIYWRALI